MIQSTTRLRRVLAIGAALGLLASLTSASVALAKPKACRKGYVRNKANRCVRKKTTTKKVTTTTAKRPTATTAKPTVAKGTIKLGLLDNSIGTNGAAAVTEAFKVGQ